MFIKEHYCLVPKGREYTPFMGNLDWYLVFEVSLFCIKLFYLFVLQSLIWLLVFETQNRVMFWKSKISGRV